VKSRGRLHERTTFTLVLLVLFPVGRNLRFVVGETVEYQAFLFEGAVEVYRAHTVLVEVQVETIVVERLFEGNGRLDLLLQDLVEVDVGEEGVATDLLGVVGVTQTLLGFKFEQSPQEGFGLGGKFFGDWHGFCRYLLEDVGFVAGVEGRFACHHVVEE
jgi:hypothetical protein